MTDTFDYHKNQFKSLEPFTINDLKYGIAIKVKGQENETHWMTLTDNCIKELLLFHKKYQKTVNDNHDV